MGRESLHFLGTMPPLVVTVPTEAPDPVVDGLMACLVAGLGGDALSPDAAPLLGAVRGALSRNSPRLSLLLTDGGSNLSTEGLAADVAGAFDAYADELCESGRMAESFAMPQMGTYIDHWVYGLASFAMCDSYGDETKRLVLGRIRDLDAPTDLLAGMIRECDDRSRSLGHGERCVSMTQGHVVIDYMINVSRGTVPTFVVERGNGYGDGWWHAMSSGVSASDEALAADAAYALDAASTGAGLS